MAQFILRTSKKAVWHQHTIWRPPICIHEARRSFTVTHSRPNVRGMRRKQEAMASANSGRPAQAHPKIQAKIAAKDMTADKIPNDVGLVPGTFIMPTGSRRPSILSDPLLLARLYWMQSKSKFLDFGARFVYRWFFWRGVPKEMQPPRPQINRRTIVPKAKELHKKLYTALARGDEDTLNDIACKNLLAEYKIRIARRRPGDAAHWKLVKYVGFPSRIVSHKCGAMGMEFGGLDLGIQQAVVKIQSIQKMKTVLGERKVDRLGRPVAKEEAFKENEEDIDWSGAKEKSVTEYIVIQRRLLKGVAEDWRVWGFAKEFDVVKLKEEDAADAEIAKDRNSDTEKRVDGGKVNKHKGIASAYS